MASSSSTSPHDPSLTLSSSSSRQSSIRDPHERGRAQSDPHAHEHDSIHRKSNQSLSDDGPSDGAHTETKPKHKEKEKKGFFSPRKGGALHHMFSASHRHKNSELHKIFTSLPATELLIDDYSCALQRDILIHGRLYLTQSWICFYANIFSWETLLTIPFQSVQAITKEKTALVIPNAIQISTTNDKYGFSSLGNRDMTYNIVFKCWQNVLLEQAISPLGLVQAARKARGESTDVGSEEELWGRSNDRPTQPQALSLATHLEIGLLPPTSLPSQEPISQSSEVTSIKDGPAQAQEDLATANTGALIEQENRAKQPAPSHLAEDTKSRTDEGLDKLTGEGVGTSRPNAEVVSIGGESIASSEYETVSLFEDTGEIPCGCSEHLGRTIINELYNCDVETIFQLIFTDTEFIRNFFKQQKQFNIVMCEWQPQPDGSRERTRSYSISLNYSFGPKFCQTTERQVYSKMGQPGLKHIVDTEVINHNIPYSDTFFVACRSCITRVANKQSRLRVTATIKFKKSCWGLVKNLIERNVGDGLGTHYSHLDAALKEHIASLPEKPKRSRRHRSSKKANKKASSPMRMTPTSPPTPLDEHRGTPQVPLRQSPLPEPDLRASPMVPLPNQKEGSLPRINLALTLLLGILVASNVLLYQQLTGYNLTTPTTTTLPQQSPITTANTKTYQPPLTYEEVAWPTSQEQWINLVQNLINIRGKEITNWQKTVTGFIHDLKKMEEKLATTRQLLLSSLEMEGRKEEELYSRLQSLIQKEMGGASSKESEAKRDCGHGCAENMHDEL